MMKHRNAFVGGCVHVVKINGQSNINNTIVWLKTVGNGKILCLFIKLKVEPNSSSIVLNQPAHDVVWTLKRRQNDKMTSL